MDQINVAVVDDHEMFRKGIISILHEVPQFVVTLEAANGQEFLDEVGSVKVDVLLLDLEMPVLGGMETCKLARERYPDLKILILTMHKTPHFMVHMMESGASGYLVKESGPEELEEAIEKVHKTGYYFSHALSQAMLQRLEGGKRKGAILEEALNAGLSEREEEVLQLICQELTTPEIAEKLYLSPRTVEGYRKQLLLKTGTRNTAGLVMWAVRQGIVG
ncbi:MAG: response regulator [Candidatus Kapaibacterium sp.]